jgi:beta-lactamase class A
MRTPLFLILLGLVGCAGLSSHKPSPAHICADFNEGNRFSYDGKSYSQKFQKELPASKLAAVLGELHTAYGDCESIIESQTKDGKTTFVTQNKGGKKLEFLLFSRDGEIEGLLFRGESLPPVSYADWQAVSNDIKKMPRGNFLLQDLDSGKTIAQSRSKERTPLGSVFKLFVLDTLAEQIAIGKMSWETPMKLNKDFYSLPGGRMQEETPGTVHTLKEYALPMIAISDNTATDHLVQLLGREAIEARIKQLNLKKSYSWNRPFLTTLDLFRVRAAFKDASYERYNNAKRSDRLKMLEALPKSDDLAKNLADWSSPRGIMQLEWYSTPQEICQLLSSIDTRATRAKDNTPRDILASNTPFVESIHGFDYAGYKGGSEPGVIQMAYLLKKKGKRYCLYIGSADTKKLADESGLFAKLKGILELSKTAL